MLQVQEAAGLCRRQPTHLQAACAPCTRQLRILDVMQSEACEAAFVTKCFMFLPLGLAFSSTQDVYASSEMAGGLPVAFFCC